MAADLNPADLASSGVTPRELKCELWQSGPPFLRLRKSEWPASDVIHPLAGDDAEVKAEIAAAEGDAPGSQNAPRQKESIHVKALEGHERPFRPAVCRAGHCVLPLKYRDQGYHFSGLAEGSTLLFSYQREGERELIRQIQIEYVPEAIACLSQGKHLPGFFEALRKAALRMTHDGLREIGGRLIYASMSDSCKTPAGDPPENQVGRTHLPSLLQSRPCGHLSGCADG